MSEAARGSNNIVAKTHLPRVLFLRDKTLALHPAIIMPSHRTTLFNEGRGVCIFVPETITSSHTHRSLHILLRYDICEA